MKRIFLAVLVFTGIVMGSCSADDNPADQAATDNVQLDGGPGSGNGGITPPPPPPPKG